MIRRMLGMGTTIVAAVAITACSDTTAWNEPHRKVLEVLPEKRVATSDEGVFGIHGPGRFLLHDHEIEPRANHSRLKGIRPQGCGSGRCHLEQ